MTTDESRLAALLEGSGDSVDVGPAPYDALWEGARRVRRTRHRRIFAGAVASVVLAVGVTSALGLPGGPGGSGSPDTPLAAVETRGMPPAVAEAAQDSALLEAEAADGLDVPAGFQLVGFQGVAVAVPEGWAPSVAEGCGVAWGPGGPVCEASTTTSMRSAVLTTAAEGVALSHASASLTEALDSTAANLPPGRVTLDGEEFATTGIRCDGTGGATCEVQVTALAEGVTLRLRSAGEPDEARRELEDLLDGVRVLGDDLAAVPAGAVRADVAPLRGVAGVEVDLDELGDDERYSSDLTDDLAAAMSQSGYALVAGPGAAAAYAAALEAAGFVPRILTERVAPAAGGELIGTVPAPGAVLPRGSEVVLRVAAPPAGPADTVRTETRYSRPNGGSATVDDASLRAGATVRVRVGDAVTVSGYDVGTSARVLLGGEVTGSAVREVDDDRVATWEVVRRGTSTITVTRSVDGVASQVGTLRVEVVG